MASFDLASPINGPSHWNAATGLICFDHQFTTTAPQGLDEGSVLGKIDPP
ncbi:hypothetical protein [Rhodococcus sp. IEGM1428]